MTAMIWRQSRVAIGVAAAVLAGLTVLLVANGLTVHHAYQAGLAACRASGTCGGLQKQLFGKEGIIIEIINLTIIAPAIIGMFLGAPLVARDLEQHTSKLIWTQAITRRRWFLTKLGWLGLVATAWSAAIAALVTWWSAPLNALGHQRLWPGQFDIQGIAPAAYSVFAFALGVTAGLLVRRTVPALGITIAGFTATRFLVTTYLRPRYLPPATAALKPGPHPAYRAQGNWTLSQRPNIQVGAARGHGHVMPHLSHASCHLTHLACLAAAGVRQIFTFQPAGCYWTLQGIETAIYLVLAAGLVAASIVTLRRAEG
jgi:hypothetical protein